MRKRDYAKAKAARIARELAEPPKELEAAIQRRIIDVYERMGCLVERRGEAQGRGGKGGGAFKTGEPDLRISWRGLTWGIEVKRDAKAPLRDDQIAWYRANSKHVPYFVVCDHGQIPLTSFINNLGPDLDGSESCAFDCRVEPFHAWVRLT